MWFNKKQNVVVTGAKGQLGSYLVEELAKQSFKKMSHIGQVLGISRDDLDLSNPFKVSSFFRRSNVDPSVKIDYVIHCAAATDTAAIEEDPLKHYASNVIATNNVAEVCASMGIKMIHISTDYVFSELSPCGEYAKLIEFPVNQYGVQKLLAEHEAQLAYFHVGHPERLVIGRLSWLFGNSDSSFVEKLLAGVFKTYARAKEAREEGQMLHNVVDDAYGRPTPVWLVRDKILHAIHYRISGIENFQFDAPQISRFTWASMILNAFYNAFDRTFSNASSYDSLRNAVEDMKAHVVLNPVKSSSMNLTVRHPGLLEDCTAKPAYDDSDVLYDQLPYAECTQRYVDKNIERLVNMMAKQLEK